MFLLDKAEFSWRDKKDYSDANNLVVVIFLGCEKKNNQIKVSLMKAVRPTRQPLESVS